MDGGDRQWTPEMGGSRWMKDARDDSVEGCGCASTGKVDW